MTKARTLANFISDGSTLADGAISVSEVSGAAPLASPSFTGNVGIGVTPATFYGRALHVHDTGTAGANIRLTDSNSGTTGNDGMDIIQINNTSYIINREAGGVNFYTGGQLRYTIQGDGTHVFNENSLDSDFRVESDNNANALFVDAGNNYVSIATASGYKNFNVGGSMAVGGSGNQGIVFGSGVVSSADQEWFLANNQSDSNSLQLYEYNSGAFVKTRLVIQSGGDFRIQSSGSGNVVINEDGENSDFRVESNNNTHALFVDASADGVGIFTGTGDTVKANFSVGLTGAIVAGDTDGATIGKGGIVNLINGNNYSSTDAGVFLLGGGTGGAVGNISSGIGFFRENLNTWGTQLRFYVHESNTVDIDMLQETARFASSEFVINDTSNNYDFRVESDSQTHALFVDAGQNKVGLNYNFGAAAGGEGSLSINTSGNGYRALAIANSTVNNSNKGAIIGGLPHANADAVWTAFGVYDDNTNRTAYMGGGGWGLPETTQLAFYTASTYNQTINAATERLRFYSSSEAVFNETGANYDFRVESDNNANMLIVDASSDIVNINSGINVNQTSLNVGGGVTISSAADDTNLAGGITVGAPFSNVAGGQIITCYGVQGTMRSATDIILEYRATSWKSYAWEVHVSNTFGYCIVRAGGYSNGFNPTGTTVDLINGANPLSAASQVNQNNQYVRLKLDSAGSGVHTHFRVIYSQNGADGVPKANRLFFTVNY
jgi:hypothetical protein